MPLKNERVRTCDEVQRLLRQTPTAATKAVIEERLEKLRRLRRNANEHEHKATPCPTGKCHRGRRRWEHLRPEDFICPAFHAVRAEITSDKRAHARYVEAQGDR